MFPPLLFPDQLIVEAPPPVVVLVFWKLIEGAFNVIPPAEEVKLILTPAEAAVIFTSPIVEDIFTSPVGLVIGLNTCISPVEAPPLQVKKVFILELTLQAREIPPSLLPAPVP